MQTADSLILWLPVAVFAAYIPFLCLMDIRDREIPHETWIGTVPLFATTVYLYSVGYYPIECMLISFAFVALYFAAMKLHIFEGADFVMLSLISLFFVANPISGRVLMPLVMLEFLIASFVVAGIFIRVIPVNGLEPKIKEFPMIPIISAAFILSVMLG
jgi:hypothetical protein